VATYVLVHGGAHGGWCYQRVASILRASGHDVYTPTMHWRFADRLIYTDLVGDLCFHIKGLST
jgi:hypothetical protein